MKIITTADGSHSLLQEELNETYHSVHGAIQESAHVFIRQGLEYVLQQRDQEKLSILEMGFGTGLNTFLTLLHTKDLTVRVSYTAIEAYPLQEVTWSKLNYAENLGIAEDFIRLHESPWGADIMISPQFQLRKLHERLEAFAWRDNPFDLVFFDAFSASKQPVLWERPMLEKMVSALRPQGVFVTYSAKGQLKRDLKSLGLFVETLAGPPGKKEMVRAVKL